MNEHLTPPGRKTFLTVSILVLGLTLACRGGGGGAGTVVVPSGLVATFTGATPASGTISLQPGAPTGNSTFTVQVAANDLTDLFSAALRIGFDPASATLVGFDASGSILNGAGVTTNFNAVETQPGQVDIVAERTSTLDRSFDAPAPAAGSITIQPGSINGDIFTLVITVTDVNDFFGAAFRVIFNPALLTFQGSDATGSLLEGGGATTNYLAIESVPGDVAVSATRIQDGGGNVPGVNVVGSQTLITLSFQAIGTTAGTAVDLGTPRQACGPQAPACASPLAVSWAGGTLVNVISTPGVDIAGSQELILLTFNATTETSGNAFTFSAGQQVCDSSAQPACNAIPVTFLDGNLTAN